MSCKHLGPWTLVNINLVSVMHTLNYLFIRIWSDCFQGYEGVAYPLKVNNETLLIQLNP